MKGLLGSPRVIGVVEGVSVRLDRCRAEHRVVKHALHAVAVAGVAGYAQQVARELEVRIGAAGRLKALVLIGKALPKRAAVGNHKVLVRTPPARGEALCSDHLEAVLRCRQIHRGG